MNKSNLKLNNIYLNKNIKKIFNTFSNSELSLTQLEKVN